MYIYLLQTRAKNILKIKDKTVTYLICNKEVNKYILTAVYTQQKFIAKESINIPIIDHTVQASNLKLHI